jgi:hypothetical protein
LVGSIPLNGDETKRPTIDVVDRARRFIRTRCNENTGVALVLRLAQRDPLSHWKEPTL